MDLFKDIKFKNWLVFGIVSFVFLTFEVIFYFLGMDFNNLSQTDFYIMTFTKYFVLIIFFIFYYSKYLKEKWKDFRKNFRLYAQIGFKDWFTGFIIMYVSNIIIMRLIGSVGQNEEAVQSMISSTPIIAFILTTILAPFLEEMIFRKSLQDCYHSKLLFMITSGFLFGLVHVLGASNALEYLLIIPYGALGFMFAHTLSKTDNIYATIMLHALHNGVLTVLSIVSTLVIIC